MLTISEPGKVPAGGTWKYVDFDSGITLTHPYFNELLKIAKKHRIANNYPIGANFNAQFEDQVCKSTPTAKCLEHVPGRSFRNPNLNARSIYNGTKVLFAFKASGSQLVEPDEAERRARICSQCPANLTYKTPCGSGGTCAELLNLVNSFVGHRKTSVDETLKACAVCQCSNRAQIWMPIEILAKGVPEGMRAEFPQETCWKIKGIIESNL